ncbi:hypothetical protein [Curtobacterium sp. SL109]|uniref:hypothetical protein n=1 Tax=Curtobacterium sp. SL109 TaxID=2994662 RepID=UPI002272E106|nr:hypothetical protein [Curtobacterium sp. SL109]MCY1694663.1 hypothetical protein [Curtobacterium sp. SL109]
MDINWDLWFKIGTVTVAVVSAVVASVNVRNTWLYRPHWARALGEFEREGQRLYNRTGEDAESVVVSYIPRIGPHNPLTRTNLIAADDPIEYTNPELLDGYIKIEWIRSKTQRLYVQDIVEPDNRPLRQRWSDARRAWSARPVRGRREKQRYVQ